MTSTRPSISKNRKKYTIVESSNTDNNSKPVVSNPPPIIFIVPYRDREHQLQFFKRHMEYIMEGINHKILYIHQTDERSFNRGAIKNIGFLVVKNLFPNKYKNITLVFNDIDSLPLSKGSLNYDTKPGTIKHFYGFTFTLGGIFSINAGDFEKIQGFPNFWAWGYEDNMIQKRAIQHDMTIDRTQFYTLHDKNMIHLQDGTFRNINRSEFDRYINKTNEGWNSITNLKYDVDFETGMVSVFTFDTGVEENIEKTVSYDLQKGNIPFKTGRQGRMKMFL